MQRRLRLLPLALSAGIVAVVAAAIPFFASGASAPATQIQYTTQTHTDFPGMGVMKLFIHGGGATTTTRTLATNRSRDDDGTLSTIMQCDLKRMIHLDNNAKTYYVLTFDELTAQMAAVQKAMANTAHTTVTPPPASAAPIEGSGGITISLNEQADSQTQTILGMTAHHVVTTMSMKGTGTGDCANFSMTMKTDEWYIPNELPALCKIPMPSGTTSAPNPQTAAQNPLAGNPCLQKNKAEIDAKAHTGDRFALKQASTMTVSSAPGITTHVDITQYQKMPYDPAFFDVPAGYTQVQAPAPQMPRH
jgi:hypothetical protein